MKKWVVEGGVWFLILLGILVMAVGEVVSGEGIESEFDLKGNATLEFKYGLGDAWRLWQRQYPINGFSLDQYLNISVSGELAEGWHLSGGIRSDPDEIVRFSTIEVSSEELVGRYGELTLSSANKYVLLGRRLPALSIENNGGPLRVSGVFAQVRSVPMEKVFHGRNSSETVIFEMDGAYLPRHTGKYLSGTVEGLIYYPLSGGFIDPEYLVVSLKYEDGATESLKDYFTSHGLGYLTDEGGVLKAGDERPLPQGRFWIGGEIDEGYLLLKTDEYGLVREDIKELIRKYNLDHGLSGDNRKTYPFEAGSSAEKAFIDGLRDVHLYIEAGYEGDSDGFLEAGLGEYRRQRFYYVGSNNVEPGSLIIYAGDGDRFVAAASIPGLNWKVNYKDGLLDFTFPSGFFNDYDSIKVLYEYRAAEGAYPLGAPVVFGSERIYVNDRLLRRDTDYSIDYKFGLLFLYRELEPTDVMRIQYELSQQGNGLPWEGGRYLVGVSASYELNPSLLLGFDLYRLAGSISTGEDDGVSPNEYTVVGINGLYEVDGLKARVDLASSREVNPMDGFVPAGSELDTKWVARGEAIGLEVNKEFKSGNVFFKCEDVDAGYMPVGWYTRKATDRWVAGGSYKLTPDVVLSYSHTSEEIHPMVGTTVSEGSGTRRWIEEATLRFIPYQVSLATSYDKVDKLQEGDSVDLIEKKVALGVERKIKGADVSLRLEGLNSEDFIDPSLSFSSYSATGSLKGQIAPGLMVKLRRVQPLSGGDRIKEETGMSIDWSKSRGLTYMSAGYDREYTGFFVKGEWGRSSTSKLDGSICTTLPGDIWVSASTHFEFLKEMPFDSLDESSGRKVNFSTRVNVGGFSVSGNTSLERMEYPNLEKVTGKRGYEVSARYDGWKDITPRVSMARTTSTTESPLGGILPTTIKTTGKFTLSRSLSSSISAEETLEVEDKKDSKDDLITYSIRERYLRRLSPQSSYSLSLEGVMRDGVKNSKETREREFTFKVVGSTPFQEDWRLNLECGYTLGRNLMVSDGRYHFLTIGVRMSISF